MEENLKINVKLTLTDIKDLCEAKAHPSIFSKIFSGFSKLVSLLMIYAIVAIIIIMSKNKDSKYTLLEFIFMSIFLIINIISKSHFSNSFSFAKAERNFSNSKAMQKLQSYEFTDSTVKISSSNGSFSFLWSDIYKLEELKPCFLIYTSPSKYCCIPRRCFSSEGQLNMFFNILSTRIHTKKLKLKKYPIGNILPDYEEITIPESNVHTIEENSLAPLVKISFSLNKKELLEMNYRLYYTKPTGIIITAIGISCLFALFGCLYFNMYSTILLSPMLLILGVIFTVLIPIKIYFNSTRSFEKDAALKKNFIYEFYSDYYIVTHPSGTSRIQFSNVVKVTEVKSAFLFFITTHAHVIPKRAFEDKNEELLIFRKIISENFSNIK